MEFYKNQLFEDIEELSRRYNPREKESLESGACFLARLHLRGTF